MNDHPFARFIRPLGRGRRARRDLEREEAREAFAMILAGEVHPEQLGAFLMLLRVKEETPGEVAGMVEAARARLPGPPPVPAGAMDWPSYAGKRRRAPWFVLAQRLLAANGRPVFCHGRSGGDARLYTRTVYEALGLPVASTVDEVGAVLAEAGLCYVELADLDPALEGLFALRPLLGLRSPVNTVARMLNPLRLPSLQGIFHPGFAPIHQQAGALLGDTLVVFRGEGGEGEVRPDGETRLYGHDGGLWEAPWPPLLAQRPVRPAQWSLQDVCNLWHGVSQDPYGQAAVIASGAVALRLLDATLSIEAAIECMRRWWEARDPALIPARPLLDLPTFGR